MKKVSLIFVLALIGFSFSGCKKDQVKLDWRCVYGIKNNQRTYLFCTIYQIVAAGKNQSAVNALAHEYGVKAPNVAVYNDYERITNTPTNNCSTCQ